MGIDAVIGPKRGGYAALRPFACCALGALAGGHDGDLPRCHFQGGKKTGQSGADDQHIADIDNIGGWTGHGLTC